MTDIHAARKRRLAIHDQNFSMIAEIDGRHAPGRKQEAGRNFANGNFRMFQPMGDGWPRITRPAASINTRTATPRSTARAERLGKLFSAGVVVENVTVTSEMDFFADSIAASIAGNASSPLTSG